MNRLTAAVLCLLTFISLTAASAIAECRYCGSTGYGSCSYSPNRCHEHVDYADRCEFCGSNGYGSCSYSPFKRHRHGHTANRCRYCGSNGYGSCSYSPHGRHEH
ncbi:hypothetical protein IJT93_11955 [bacterium]|nr:hypothetical protein [bacterium]